MKSFKAFLIESNISILQKFIITAWGKLLYLDYFGLPAGKNNADNRVLLDIAEEYFETDNKDDLDEWIAEGCPMKNSSPILTKETVDSLLNSCQSKIDQILYRFDHTTATLKPNTWISLTTQESGYGGNRTEYSIKKAIWLFIHMI